MARSVIQSQQTDARGIPVFNAPLQKSALAPTNSQLFDTGVYVSSQFQQILDIIEPFKSITPSDLKGEDGERGPPGPAGQDGYVNVNYDENVADELPVFSFYTIGSNWVVTQNNIDVSTDYGFIPLGGLNNGGDSQVSYPIYDTTAGYFIPTQSSLFSTSVALSSVSLPSYTMVPFHVDRIIQNISWQCPVGIAFRMVVVGKPENGEANYVTRYYQIQGEKIFEEYYVGDSLITTEKRNDEDYTYIIPNANDDMPKMRSVSVLIYSIKYIPVAQRASYIGDIDSLSNTDDITTGDADMLSKGISVRLGCKNYVVVS